MPACCLVFLSTALAAPAGVPEAAVAAWQEMNQVRRIEAHFEQTRTSSLMSRPITSTGTLRFERPDRFAWITDSPAQSVMILDGSRLLMGYPQLDVREEVQLSGDPEIERLVRSMMVWLAGDLDAVARDYTVAWLAGTPDRAVLTPKDETMGRLIGRLELSIGGRPLRVQAVDIVEPDGDTVHIALSDVRVDPDLPPDAFLLP